MQKYIQKMIEEESYLKGKIKQAEKVIANPPFDSDKTGLEMLSEQVKAMKVYSEILHKRIEYEGARK